MEKDALKPIEGTTITLSEAMDRTNNWRQTVKPIFNDDVSEVPKGFFIHFDDIKALAEKYPEAAGVRAYFTLLSPGFTPGEGVSGILVPVAFTEDRFYRDILDRADADGAPISSIYDFTKPCPDSCDETSPLN